MANKILALPTFLYSFFSFLSRVSGYIRDLFLASFLGTSVLSDIFFIAFRIPYSFRRGLSEETFNPAFIPVVGKIKDLQGIKDSRKFSSNVLMLFLLLFLVVFIFGEIFMVEILYFFSLNINDPDDFDLLIYVSRIMFPYLLLFPFSAIVLANLNAKNKFSLSGAFPAILNIALILSISAFALFNQEKIIYLAYSVLFGGLIQLVVLVFHLNKDYFTDIFKYNFLNIKNFFSLYWPTLLASFLFQVNLLYGIYLCSFEPGAVSYIYYAERLFFFPVILIGSAIGVVLMPNMSNALRSGQKFIALGYLGFASKYALILTIPITSFLFALSPEIVTVLFERGEFGKESSLNTSLALSIFLIGLPAATLSKIFSSYFFAAERPKIYLKIAIYSNAINLVLMLSLYEYFSFLAIPVALSLSSYFMIAMMFFEHKKNNFYIFRLGEVLQLLRLVVLGVLIFYSCNLSQYISIDIFSKSISTILISSIMSSIIFLIYLALFERVLLKKSFKIIFEGLIKIIYPTS